MIELNQELIIHTPNLILNTSTYFLVIEVSVVKDTRLSMNFSKRLTSLNEIERIWHQFLVHEKSRFEKGAYPKFQKTNGRQKLFK